MKRAVNKDCANIKVKKRIHAGFTEFQSLPKGLIEPIFGKWQYIWKSDKGKISLIQFVRLYDLPWEILSTEGDLFEDVERFKTKKEAEDRIMELLK